MLEINNERQKEQNTMRRRRRMNRNPKSAGAEPRHLEKANERFRRFVAPTLVLAALSPTAALAADLPGPGLPSVYKEPPATYNWTGFYVGGNIGAAWQGVSGSNFSDTLGSAFTSPTNLQFMGGAQTGLNYEFGNGVVIGAEAMFDWLPASGNAAGTATDPTGTVAANISPMDARWLITTTGKLGYAWDRILLYGKSGGAWVASATPSISVASAPASFSSVSNTTNATWTAGFGLEWAFYGNWLLRAEYDYIALPSQSLTVAPGTPTFGGDVITFNNRNLSIFTLAINYKFGGW